MNLRRMLFIPNEKYTDKISFVIQDGTLVWNGKVYTMVRQDNGDCKHCDAHKDRMKRRGFVNGGMCPDSDPNLDWSCFDRDINKNIILRHRL